MKTAPIALFVYNRPWHTQQTIKALQRNPEIALTDLFIFSDGPKTVFDEQSVQTVRRQIAKTEGFQSVTIFEQTRNQGLAESIISGVSTILQSHERIIVLEDDLIVSQYFLRYMNSALEKYEEESRIISIHGYVYPVRTKLPECFLLRGADCWGWATWRRGWALFERNGQLLIDEIEREKGQYDFDFYNTYPYTQMLRNNIAGLNNSWAIRWYASAYVLNKLTLYPGRSLVQNIGFDMSGTHAAQTNKYQIVLTESPIHLFDIPIREDLLAKKAISDYFRSLQQRSWFSTFRNLARILRKFLKNPLAS